MDSYNLNLKPQVTICKYQTCGCCAYCQTKCECECIEVPDTCDGDISNVS